MAFELAAKTLSLMTTVLPPPNPWWHVGFRWFILGGHLRFGAWRRSRRGFAGDRCHSRKCHQSCLHRNLIPPKKLLHSVFCQQHLPGGDIRCRRRPFLIWCHGDRIQFSVSIFLSLLSLRLYHTWVRQSDRYELIKQTALFLSQASLQLLVRVSIKAVLA